MKSSLKHLGCDDIRKRPSWRRAFSYLAAAGALAVSGVPAVHAADSAPPPDAGTMKAPADGAILEPGHMPPPGLSETPESAFKKLDKGAKGYVTREDVAALPGFDKAFQSVDTSGKGKLTLAEFKKAWSQYTSSKG